MLYFKNIYILCVSPCPLWFKIFYFCGDTSALTTQIVFVTTVVVVDTGRCQFNNTGRQ